MSGTMLYDGQPRGISDLDEWRAYRAEIAREVAEQPGNEDARAELYSVDQQLLVLQRPAADL